MPRKPTVKKPKYRSKFEQLIGESLANYDVKYEAIKISFIQPESEHNYTPDFILPNGTIIEAKGLFCVEDRKKHLLIKDQHPDLDIRFLFQNAYNRISKSSSTTYADWCDKHGFLWAHKAVPRVWLTIH